MNPVAPPPDDLSPLRKPAFQKAISDLEELMTQSGRAFLLGAGCSKCAGLPLTAELTDKCLTSACLDSTTKDILQAVRQEFDGATSANIEDLLSEIIDLLAIADRRATRGAKNAHVVITSKTFTTEQLRDACEHIKNAIVEVLDQEVTIEKHWDFIRAVHRPLRPGKSVLPKPVDYLVLNYDTLIEDALALEKLTYADGMDGGLTAWWDSATLSKTALCARVIKLHGSINWCELADDPLPRRVSTSLKLPANTRRKVLIWPASTKYRETQRDPYAQLATRMRAILRPSDGSQTVLMICGYSFGDSHINLEIDKALHESDGQLTVVCFTFDDKPEGQLKEWFDNDSVREQVRIYSKKGFFHADVQETSTVDLPWWKFENITRLLEGKR